MLSAGVAMGAALQLDVSDDDESAKGAWWLDATIAIIVSCVGNLPKSNKPTKHNAHHRC